jgi:hypothetical protein
MTANDIAFLAAAWRRLRVYRWNQFALKVQRRGRG